VARRLKIELAEDEGGVRIDVTTPKRLDLALREIHAGVETWSPDYKARCLAVAEAFLRGDEPRERTHSDAMFAVDVLIEATDRTGLLRDIMEILSRERLNVTATNSASRDSSARILLTVEIDNLEHLHRVLTLVKNVAGVSRAVRR
jgi:predicted amino acid-binding ACT domain protein